jgi:DNA-binding protein H-NS
MIEDIDFSSYSLEQLKALVQGAKREIALKERNQVQEIYDRILELANSVGMSMEDLLGFEDDPKNKGLNGTENVKFRNPNNPDQTWVGRGKRPQWLRQALEQGAKLEEFSVA